MLKFNFHFTTHINKTLDLLIESFVFNFVLFQSCPPRQKIQKPARIPPQTPPPRGQNPKSKLVSVLRKSISPENSFCKTESELKPRHTARMLGGQNPKKKNVLSILEKIHPRENQKSKEHFFFLGLPSEARRWRGFRGAYTLVSLHHALRACG